MEDQASGLRNIVNSSKLKSNVRTIAVTSGKGGVGKTNISTNLAIMLALMKKKVLILDADMGLANIDILLGIHPKYNLQHVISGEKSLEEILVDGPAGIKIIPAASGFQSLTELTDSQRNIFIKEFSKFQYSVDYLIIDTGAGISKNVTEFIKAAGEAIVVTTAEPTAITDAYALIKVMSKDSKDLKMHLFINMVDDLNEAKEVEAKLKSVVDKFIGISINAIGFMTKDSSVVASIRKQAPFVLDNTRCHATACIKNLAKSLCNYSVQEKDKSLLNFAEQITGVETD